jgi:hypothetical protein
MQGKLATDNLQEEDPDAIRDLDKDKAQAPEDNEQEQGPEDGAQDSMEEDEGLQKTDQEFKAAGSKAKEATKKTGKDDENMDEVDPDANQHDPED